MTRACSFLLLAAFTQACTKWSVAQVGPSLADESRVLVTTPASRIELQRPTISADTLRDHRGIRVPIAQIRQAEVRRLDGLRTGLLVIGMAVVVFSVALADDYENAFNGKTGISL